jgi:methionyl-tRNA formyltransferase
MSNMSLKIAFLGTPAIACPSLEKLINQDGFEILAVITQPDQKIGRKQILTPTPVKELALKHNLPVFQPEKLRKDTELLNHLKSLNLDFLVVIAYGQILSQETLDIPKIAPINVHGSILPKYRGASPIEEALLNGDSETGISIMEMDEKMDEGPVYKIYKLPISPEENNQTLREKMAVLSAENLPDALFKIASGEFTAQIQDHTAATFCHKITKADGLINPRKESAETIYHKFQAYYTWPGITWNYQNRNFKIINLKVSSQKLPPGEIQLAKNQLLIGSTSTALEILEIQMEGKKTLPIKDFLSGNRQIFQLN